MRNWENNLKNFSRILTRKQEYFSEESRDWSIDVAIHLALAFYSLKKLEESGVDLKLRNRFLILPSLIRAFRELLHLRKDIPVDIMSNDIERKITLSKYGEILDAEKNKTTVEAYRK